MRDRQSDSSRTADLGDVRLDLDRRRRCGFPEVVFGESKDVATLKRVIERLLAEGEPVLITRVAVEKGTELTATFPQGRYNAVARTFVAGTLRVPLRADGTRSVPATCGRVAIVAAGTSDMPVAEEVRETIEWMGVSCELIVDVGVAGPHRLQEALPKIVGSDAVVVVAGMEAALASVVGGHVDCPVIAVPTSVGYGASFGGVAALLGMLNSCAANVSVVNIDAGFKGGYIAGLIARRRVSGSR
jgi:NCAIR mutase (PurE)-related protein